MNHTIDGAPDGRRMGMHQSVGARRNGIKHRLYVGGRACDHLEDVGGSGLPLKCFLGLVEQPRVLDGDHGLIGKGLLEHQLFRRERQQPVAIDDENADRVAVPTQWRAAHGSRAGGAGMRQARPVRHRGVDMVEVRNMYLSILGDDGAWQILTADPDRAHWNGGTDTFRTATIAKNARPLTVFSKPYGNAG